MWLYIYIHTWKTIKNHKDTIFCPYGFGHYFCPLRFFSPNTAMSGCKPSTYRSIVFLKSWIVGLVPTVWVSRLETVFGAVCWHLLTVFLNMMLNKYYSILWVHPNLVGNMAVFVARFGYLITTPNLLHFGLKLLCWRLPEDVRTRCCQSIFEQPFTITNQNTQLNKKNVRYG